MLPCRTEAAKQRGAEVCWGRGKPSLFTCHNTVLSSAADHVTYRKSYRYSLASSSSSLSIFSLRPSDSGFYHCRVQVPGLFNDQTFTVFLLIVSSPSVAATENSELSNQDLNAPHTTAGHIDEDTGRDVTGDSSTEPVVALVQSAVQQQVNTLKVFVGNTVRASILIFIPALVLAAAYRVWRSKQEADRRPGQSEEAEEESSAV